MKFSYRQILASAAGAVLSAVIASIFGVKGTIVGVAIGSIAATTGTALVFQSIERTNKAVKQAVVHAPDNAMLRRLGGTKVAGVISSGASTASAVHEETATSAAATDATVEQPRPSPAPVEASEPRTSVSTPRRTPRTDLRWPQIAGVVAVVFVVSLVFVTVVELIAGRPLADHFGHTGGGTTVDKIFETPTTTLPPPTTTTTSTSTTTTSSSSSSTTTSTLGGTTTTGGGPTTTSTTSSPGVTDTTPSTSVTGTSTTSSTG